MFQWYEMFGEFVQFLEAFLGRQDHLCVHEQIFSLLTALRNL